MATFHAIRSVLTRVQIVANNMHTFICMHVTDILLHSYCINQSVNNWENTNSRGRLVTM